jgi:hypothetical protein
MAHRKIEVVIAGPGAGHRDYVRFFTKLIGRGPQRIGGVEVWWDVDPEGLLAVTPIS